MKRKFSTISSIDLDKPHSWQDPSFITLDIDWCHDEVLAYSINLLEQADVSATWFVTHDTPLLERLRANPKFELGIHPNFNFLLQGDSRNGKDAEEVVDRLIKIVPEAISIRSHSLLQSSRLMELFKRKGFRYECNSYQPVEPCKPSLLWNHLVKVPHFWEDDFSLLYGVDLAIPEDGLTVYDFHPIHVFLNSPDMNIYNQSRKCHNFPEKLQKYRCDSTGVCNWFIELISMEYSNEA